MHKIVLYILLLFCCAAAAQTRVAGVPYSCDFENAAENSNWVLMNGTKDNKWFIDTAANNGGHKSLYISNTLGTSNNYNNYGYYCVWACRPIYLTPGHYSVTYDWRSKGNLDYAFMRAYIVPASAFLSSSGAGNPNGLYPHATPAGWISLSDEFLSDEMMVGKQNWEQLHIPVVNISAADTYYLAFGWRNASSSIQGQPPAAVDNIQIDTATCPRPRLLRLTHPNQGQIYARWVELGSATQWRMEYSTSPTFANSHVAVADASNTNRIGDTIHFLINSPSTLLANTTYFCRVWAVCPAYGNSLVSEALEICLCTDNCFNYTDLHSPYVVCTYGQYMNYGENGPFTNVGVVDYGPDNYQNSMHTVHYIRDYDSLTLYQLPKIPPGECASVRLGSRSRDIHRGHTITYSFWADSANFDAIKIRYALVMQEGLHEPESQTPRFVVELLGNNNMPIDSCGIWNEFPTFNHNSNNIPPGWHNIGGTLFNRTIYKEWSTFNLDLSRFHGQNLKLRLSTYTCGRGVVCLGYAYYTLRCERTKIAALACNHGSDSVTLSAPEGYYYKWIADNANGTTLSTARNITVPSDSSLYFCHLFKKIDTSCNTIRQMRAIAPHSAAYANFEATVDACNYKLDLRNASYITSLGPTHDTLGLITDIFWDFGDSTYSTAQNPQKSYSRPGTYTVRLVIAQTDSTCADTIERQFVFPPHTHGYITAPNVLCEGDTALLSLTGGHFAHCLWSTGDTTPDIKIVPRQPITIMLVATDTLGCTDTLSATIDVYNCHLYDTVCANVPYTLNGFNLQPDSLKHFVGTEFFLERNQNTDSLLRLHLFVKPFHCDTSYAYICTGDTLFFEGLRITQGGTYTRTYLNVYGCDSTKTLILTQHDPPDLSISFRTQGCYGNPVTLTAVTSGDWIRWRSSPTDSTLLGHETDNPITVIPWQPINYFAAAGWDSLRCTVERIAHLSFETEIKAIINASPPHVTLDNSMVLFLDNSLGTTDRTWYMGSFDNPVSQNSSYNYSFKPNEDSVTVILEAFIDSTICRDTASITIYMEKEALWVPSAFTPDGNNNTVFFAKGVGIAEFEIYIYNREGLLVFHSTDIDEAWNGCMHNNCSYKCITGNYVYRITYSTIYQTKSKFNKVGSVLLIR